MMQATANTNTRAGPPDAAGPAPHLFNSTLIHNFDNSVITQQNHGTRKGPLLRWSTCPKGGRRVTHLDLNTPAAMAGAVTPHLGSIWRYALSLSGKPDIADDLTQATVLRAMEKHAQFRPDSNLTGWCLTICRSIWLNELRSNAIRKTKSLSSTTEIQEIVAHFDVETNILAAQVFTQVMELPEAQRETVILVYVEGFKYSEAAEILDVPIGTIMSRLSVARSKLKHLGQAVQAPTAQGTK